MPIRYGRMLVSPFAFHRGTTAVMAHDFAPLPRSGLEAQLCGDAHLGNFGGFGSPERDLVFDLNDFDETLPGPFEWDVKRLAVSIEIAGRSRKLGANACRTAVVAMVHSYREAMHEFAELGNLDVWYARVSVDGLVDEAEPGTAGRGSVDGRPRRREGADARSPEGVQEAHDHRRRRAANPLGPAADRADRRAPRRARGPEAIEALVRSILAGFRSTLQPDRRRLLDSYEVVDVAHKVVGVSSVGTRCWIVLMVGRDTTRPAVRAGEGGPGLGARALPRRVRATQRTASASSRDSV